MAVARGEGVRGLLKEEVVESLGLWLEEESGEVFIVRVRVSRVDVITRVLSFGLGADRNLLGGAGREAWWEHGRMKGVNALVKKFGGGVNGKRGWANVWVFGEGGMFAVSKSG